MPINKFTTLLDLARQAKIITGETATFDGKIQAGIPFSGYPTGVDTGTTVSLGVVSTQTAIFSGNTGTTIFDVSNPSSPNYSPLFSGFSGNVWTNSLFSGNTSGLTLPITTFSADTQVVGPFWVLTQTGTTGDYVIGTQYTGYSITYAFSFINDLGAPTTAYTSYSGYTTASQENFSAGTLDYKGPLDYISTKEDASVEGRLTTNKITITNGASASTIGYVLTQTGENGEAEWVINASADTNTYVTGGTLTGTDLTLDWNTGGSANNIDLSGLEFTGNTSGDCITDLYVRRLYGCSPITVHDTITYNGSIIDSATTNSFIFGTNHVLTGSSVTHGVTVDANAILGGSNNRIVPFQLGTYNTIIGGENNTLGVGRIQSSAIISSDDSTIDGSTGPNVILGGTNNIINGGNGSVIIGGLNNTTQSGVDNSSILGGSNNIILSNVERSVVLGGSGITGTTNDTVYTPNLDISGNINITNTSANLFSTLGVTTPFDNRLTLSGNTLLLTEYLVQSPSVGGFSFGIRGASEPSFDSYGKVGDGYIYSSVDNNGINIISAPTNPQTTDDYIRFFAGLSTGATATPDLHIQGSGTTRGNVGINTDTPTEKLHIEGSVRIVDGTEQNGYVLTCDSNGVGSWSSGFTQTKEVFFKPTFGFGNVFLKGNYYPYYTDGGVDPLYIQGSIPFDVNTIISSEVLTIPEFTSTEPTELDISYAGVGQVFSATTLSTTPSISYTTNEVKSIDVLNIFSGTSANDVFGFNIFQNNAKLFVLGIKIKYTT